MKKFLMLIELLTAGVYAYGQGYLYFANTSATLIQTNSSIGGLATGPISEPVGSYYFALFSAPSGTVDVALFSFTGVYETNRATAGRIGSVVSKVPIPGTQEITPTAFFVRGWSANIGPSYEALADYLGNPTFEAWYGQSEIRTLVTGAPDLPTPILFGLTPTQIPGFTLGLVAIPEPSALPLAGLGVTAVWFIRRRSL